MLKMDRLNDEDLMDKVMNRPLGGGTSTGESSPLKQQTLSSKNGDPIQLQVQSSLSSCKYHSNGSPVTTFANSEPGEEKSDIDEIDGFTEDKIESRIDKDLKLVRSVADRNTRTIEVTDCNKSVNCFNQNHILNKGDHAKHEYVLESEDDKNASEPRIEMFNESDSNSNSNPFILSSFQSLNTSGNAYSPETNATETEFRMDIDYSKFSGENYKQLELKNTETNCNSSTQNSSHGVSSHESEKGKRTSRSDYIIYKTEHLLEFNKESQSVENLKSVLHTDLSDHENGSEGRSLNADKIIVRNSLGEISATDVIETGEIEDRSEKKMSDRICKETENHVVINNGNTLTIKNENNLENKDERLDSTVKDKKELVSKSVAKKSRKQYVPKRVRKYKSSDDNCDEVLLEFIESDREVNENTFKFEASCNSKATDDEITLEGNDGQPEDEEVEQKKSEKSRKQFKPKRIDQLENINEKASVPDNKTIETGIPEVVRNITHDRGIKNNYKQENEYLKMLTVECKVKENEYVDSIKSECGVNQDNGEELVRLSDGFEESQRNSHQENKSETTESSECSSLNTSEGGAIDHFASMSSNPFYYGFSPDLNLISSLTPGILQGGCSSPSGFALDETGPENLEVIRQLREIRCNRYRKISIAEKREISAYANAHGVSQAATYYNVSKSAVSMWTKLDFSSADEDSGMKRKNCMSGNEKFEALCRKVKNERENKFKGMTKQDKFEVSRYAKLVGVREMSRCLGVALGTVSGWMRQFPYKVETDSLDDNSKSSNTSKDKTKMDETGEVDVQNEKSIKRKQSEQFSKCIKKRRNTESVEVETDSYKTIQKDDTMYIIPVDADESMNGCDIKDDTERFEDSVTENDFDCSLEQKDELDKMIAETLQKPDAEKCFEDVKDMIKDSPLEGDEFFRSLFDRVIACRADKYKTLKPSEKLEVVRYAKRIGVRRVAKILGLATGTLSGWNTKYQSSLGIPDSSLDVSNKNDLLVSYLSPDRSAESESVAMTPGALMDNSEKSEVTAVKLLFKDRFPTLLKKIEIAKQVKFKNITTVEKIEFVKCSKLVGIRPTARVFGIPIGTLSGWISKYSKLLHPAYHVDVEQDNISSSSESTAQMFNPSTVGRNPVFQGGISSTAAWPQIPSLIKGSQGSLELNMFPNLQSIPSSTLPASSSVSSSPESFSSLSNTSGTVPQQRINDTGIGSKYLASSQSKIYDDASVIVNQSDPALVIRKETGELGTQSTSEDDFEKEAKLMAEQYLTAAYKTMGLPIG